jgi:glutamate carboxypeptidase
MRYFPIVVLLLLPVAAYGAGLSSTEKKISRNAQENSAAAIQLLEKVVNINSGTMNHEGVRKVGEIFAQELSSLGLKTRWIPMNEVNRTGHLIAEQEGKKGKRILLIGHLDTVFEKENPFHPFTRKDESHATGQGVNDMKGGDVIVMFALKALHDAGVLKDARILVVFTGDEEDAGLPHTISRRDLIEAAKRSDIALAFETATGFDYATVARRGVSSWMLQVKGMQAHSSGIFSEETGSGAVFEASRILTQFYEKLRGEKYLTFNPAVILGGTEVTYDPEHSRGTVFGKTNVIAKKVTIQGDLRFITDEQKQGARTKMREIATSQNLPHTSAEISFEDGYPSMPPTQGNLALLKVLDQASRDLGFGPVEAYDPGARGAGDISFVANQVDCLDGLGALGSGAHTQNEDVDLSAFSKLIQRTAILIYRLTR